MEIRARYTLIGLFTLFVFGAAFAFVYWLNHAGGLTQQALYRARFENTVSGLLKGSAVLFNGIRVGEVVALELSPENPKQVTAVMPSVRETPVRSDTKVGYRVSGLDGRTGSVAERRSTRTHLRRHRPTVNRRSLPSTPDAGQNVTDAARGVLRHIDAVVSDNAEPLRTLIANINTFSGALARNSDRVDGILSGLERMTGGGHKSPRPMSLISKRYKAFRPWLRFRRANW